MTRHFARYISIPDGIGTSAVLDRNTLNPHRTGAQGWVDQPRPVADDVLAGRRNREAAPCLSAHREGGVRRTTAGRPRRPAYTPLAVALVLAAQAVAAFVAWGWVG